MQGPVGVDRDAMYLAWRHAEGLDHASDGQVAFYAGYAAASRDARLAVEILFCDLLDEDVALGLLCKMVKGARQTIADGPVNRYEPSEVLLGVAVSLARVLITGGDGTAGDGTP